MPIIQLHIQGMTHHDIAARREEFVSTAVGRRIALRAARLCEDGRTVEAYVGGECVGVVARLDRDLAVGALRTEEKGGVLRGRIVEARDYVLLAEIKVAELPQVEAPASVLRDWKYSGPLLAERAEERKLAFLEEELTALLTEDADVDVEEVLELLQVFCRTAPYDISAEGLELRRQLVQWLSAAEDAHLREAAELVREMSQRMGGDTWMAQLGEWMKAELPTSREALTMEVEAAALAEVRAEAERLPQGLMALWRSDMAQFVRVLYGMLPTREKLRRVLSCLVVLELADGAGEREANGTEEEFVQDFVKEAKRYYRHNPKRADDVCHILGNMGLREAEAELDAWIEESKKVKAVVVTEKVTEKAPQVPHFPACRSYDQGVATLQFLKENGFVPGDTEATNFLFRMGCAPQQPQQPQPVVWLKSKQLLREMLEMWFASAIEDRSLKKSRLEALSPQVFSDEDGEMIHLAKNKPSYSWESDELKDFFATI